MRLTGVWKKQRAALAVDDLLDNCCILGEGPGGARPRLGIMGFTGAMPVIRLETGVKLWSQERNMDENTEHTTRQLLGKQWHTVRTR